MLHELHSPLMMHADAVQSPARRPGTDHAGGERCSRWTSRGDAVLIRAGCKPSRLSRGSYWASGKANGETWESLVL